MKAGLVREKFGDIIVRINSVDGYSGADVICFNSVSKIMMDTIPYLTRFKKSNISVIPIDLIEPKIEQFEFISIIISSNRLDNFVSELAHCSRGNAQEYLKLGKVFINGVNEFKDSKKLIEGDTITIRGKGKFIFDSIIGETKNNRLNILIKKYK
jgi:RNA-binding protein YlmH